MTSDTTWVRELIDPNGTLPDAELVLGFDPDETLEPGYDKYFEVRHQGEIVGRGNISEIIQDDDEPFTCFTNILIDEKYKGKGIGLATYVCAIELCDQRGEQFRSDFTVSESAKYIWELLAEREVAVVVDEFELAKDLKGSEDFYRGHYTI